MPALRAQVIIKTTDGVAENFITNSWCFRAPDVFSGAPLIRPALEQFYNTMVNAYPAKVAQNAHEIKWYELPGPGRPNYPFLVTTFNLTSLPVGPSLPSEVALCLSFQAVKFAGEPQARKRGRIYFGPLDESANSDGRPTAGWLTGLAGAGQTLKDDVEALGANYHWCVWSETNQTEVPVDNGWVDNSWDTQRRRGVDPTSRTVFT